MHLSCSQCPLPPPLTQSPWKCNAELLWVMVPSVDLPMPGILPARFGPHRQCTSDSRGTWHLGSFWGQRCDAMRCAVAMTACHRMTPMSWSSCLVTPPLKRARQLASLSLGFFLFFFCSLLLPGVFPPPLSSHHHPLLTHHPPHLEHMAPGGLPCPANLSSLMSMCV